MPNLRKLLGWTLPMLAMAAVVAGEIAVITSGAHWTRRAERRDRELAGEWRRLVHTTPAPRVETANELEVRLVAARSRLNALEAAASGTKLKTAMAANAGASNRADEFFERAAFVERMRNRLRAAGVEFKAAENFGSAPREGAGATGVERMVVETVLTALIAAPPDELLSVECLPGRVAPRRTSGEAAERVWCAVRLRFVGRTESLRGLLNGVVVADLPLFTRQVEVEPPAAENASGGAGQERESVAAKENSRFMVVVELAESAAPAPDAA